MTPAAPARPPSRRFRLGIDTLLADHREWLAHRRVGLVSHDAAVDQAGTSSAAKLRGAPDVNLAALFGPEHGFSGRAGAGELTHDTVHPAWGIPVFSLYGETRQPNAAMLGHVDVLIVELQDLGARPYTYASTLRLVLEAAARAGKTVIVADRPVPLPAGIDGPLLDPAFESFVGFVPTPMQYGMTPAETALWLTASLRLPVDLRVAPMAGYRRDAVPAPDWPPWVPPSPRIRSWESACLFTCTVCGEALPALDYGSGTDLSFQVLGAPWLDRQRLLESLRAASLSGVAFEPLRYTACRGLYAGNAIDGLRLVITDYARFRPVTTGIAVLDRIQRLYGLDPLWSAPGTRPEWFDKLFGTDSVRKALCEGRDAASVAESWTADGAAFLRARRPFLLYSPEGAA